MTRQNHARFITQDYALIYYKLTPFIFTWQSSSCHLILIQYGVQYSDLLVQNAWLLVKLVKANGLLTWFTVIDKMSKNLDNIWHESWYVQERSCQMLVKYSHNSFKILKKCTCQKSGKIDLARSCKILFKSVKIVLTR